MQKHAINDLVVVIFAIAVLAALCITAVHRSHEIQATKENTPVCHALHCHAMSPAHWL